MAGSGTGCFLALFCSLSSFTQVMTSLMLVCHCVTEGEKNFCIIWNNQCDSLKMFLKKNIYLQTNILGLRENEVDDGREDQQHHAGKGRLLQYSRRKINLLTLKVISYLRKQLSVRPCVRPHFYCVFVRSSHFDPTAYVCLSVCPFRHVFDPRQKKHA